ncbi:MAG: LysM peptidoglycan-binding domain-containing protein [Desulfobacteraceae bacterium]|nr:LysM peptidoglycan-binding domain-containing protein [Desulfobacteraceae bacterium]
MLGQKYTVKRGDSLWSIAGKFLGDSTKWPKIFEHNNKPMVSMVTKTVINDPCGRCTYFRRWYR